MAERFEVYKCDICGNIVEVLDGEDGILVCCGDDMKRMASNTVDAAVEKHVPVPHREVNGLKIAVGEVPHPMTEEHFIEWIDIRVGNMVQRKYLKPGEAPTASFTFPENLEKGEHRPVFRAYCNLHGLWQSEG